MPQCCLYVLHLFVCMLIVTILCCSLYHSATVYTTPPQVMLRMPQCCLYVLLPSLFVCCYYFVLHCVLLLLPFCVVFLDYCCMCICMLLLSLLPLLIILYATVFFIFYFLFFTVDSGHKCLSLYCHCFVLLLLLYSTRLIASSYPNKHRVPPCNPLTRSGLRLYQVTSNTNQGMNPSSLT